MNASLAITASPPRALSRLLVLVFAFCCGAIVANLYYAQPVVGLIAADLHLSAGSAGLIVSLTQIGYALGLLFVVPLADLVENRKLMICTSLVATASLLLAGLSQHAGLFLALSLLIGFSSVAVQILVPLAAHMAPEHSRGRVVGSIMGGLLLGILLARPLSSLVADHFGWRILFMGAALVMLGIIVLLSLLIPRRVPQNRVSYVQLMGSLLTLLRRYPMLRQRSLYQALMFAAFSLFWTAVPLELMHAQGLSQSQIAVFALVGAIGAVAAPIAGRLADAGHTRRASQVAMGLAPLAMLIGVSQPGASLWGLALTGILLDFAVQMNMVLGQREVYALDAASRARLNALYMTCIFLGGALGSALAGVLYQAFAWSGIALAGALLPGLALLLFVTRR